MQQVRPLLMLKVAIFVRPAISLRRLPGNAVRVDRSALVGPTRLTAAHHGIQHLLE